VFCQVVVTNRIGLRSRERGLGDHGCTARERQRGGVTGGRLSRDSGNVACDMPHGDCSDRDPARSYEPLDTSDLARLGRAAHAELDAFFARNPHLAGWRDRVRIVALAQGGAEHYLRGRRGVRTSTSSSALPQTRVCRTFSAA
jgi:hypothetical protein